MMTYRNTTQSHCAFIMIMMSDDHHLRRVRFFGTVGAELQLLLRLCMFRMNNWTVRASTIWMTVRAKIRRFCAQVGSVGASVIEGTPGRSASGDGGCASHRQLSESHFKPIQNACTIWMTGWTEVQCFRIQLDEPLEIFV